MVRAMLNYGGYAQIFFDGTTSGLANSDLYTSATDPVQTWAEDLTEYKHTFTTADDTKGITANSATLVLESQTELRFYFTLEDGKTLSDYNFALDDTTKTLVTGYNSQKGKYYVAVPDIGPAALDNMYTLTVTPNGETDAVITISYSALSYARTVINSSTSTDALKNLVKALYYYNQAAADCNTEA